MRLVDGKERDLDATHHIDETFVIESERSNEWVMVEMSSEFTRTSLGLHIKFSLSQIELHSSRWSIVLD